MNKQLKLERFKPIALYALAESFTGRCAPTRNFYTHKVLSISDIGNGTKAGIYIYKGVRILDK